MHRPDRAGSAARPSPSSSSPLAPPEALEVMLLRGQVLVENGDLVAQPGVGQFVKRARFGEQLGVDRHSRPRLGGRGRLAITCTGISVEGASWLRASR